MLGYKRRPYQPPVIKVPLPQRDSEKIRSYAAAIRYAQEDGASRVQKTLYRERGIGLCCPYGGYGFTQLSAKCDPYIFCKGVNKYCLRYAGQDLLPKGILENRKKTGTPGTTLEKVMSSDATKHSVRRFVEQNKNDPLVDSALVLKHLEENRFGQQDFLALCLLVFAQRLQKLGVELVF